MTCPLAFHSQLKRIIANLLSASCKLSIFYLLLVALVTQDLSLITFVALVQHTRPDRDSKLSLTQGNASWGTPLRRDSVYGPFGIVCLIFFNYPLYLNLVGKRNVVKERYTVKVNS